ncbi:hypothetical protein AK812_SmicGene25593 [Symbiodinium microadriaticum]|uniref:Uncharacterized protein n=1 Tax=Symbiodinium microadriaticum TaxID=2951 RepID=A0A1Q9DBG8_SYMMI|nr:hypothetical protein AK812_SmicGene25593 [Symbiodinium microadriaticum]
MDELGWVEGQNGIACSGVATISVTYSGLGPNDEPRLFQVKLHELFNKNRGVIDELRCRVAQAAHVSVFRVKLREFEGEQVIKDSDGWKKVGCPHSMFASIDPVLTSLNDDLHLATAAASAEVAISSVPMMSQKRRMALLLTVGDVECANVGS